MLKPEFKEKYLAIARSQSVEAAITQLQRDIIEREHEAFEGEKGYQPEIIAKLEEVREFSRELWEKALRS